MFKMFQASGDKHGGGGHGGHGNDHGGGHGHDDHGHGKHMHGHGSTHHSDHDDHGHDDHHDHGHGHGHSSTSIDVKIENGDIIEEELGQVALDILDCSDKIIILAPIAGMDTENVDISISRNILTISGERIRPDIYDTADRALVEECFFGPFSRSVILPENLAFNKIHATMEYNLLLIEIPKLIFAEKTIKINKLES